MINDILKSTGGLFILYLLILTNYTTDILGVE